MMNYRYETRYKSYGISFLRGFITYIVEVIVFTGLISTGFDALDLLISLIISFPLSIVVLFNIDFYKDVLIYRKCSKDIITMTMEGEIRKYV